MSILVAVCTAVIVGAAGIVLFTFGITAEPLLNALSALPPPQKAIWATLIVAFAALLPATVWLSDLLVKQRKANKTLELRLGGVRQDVNARDKVQAEAESQVNFLVRTDPEDRIAGLQHRITEADRFAQMQQSRSEVGDLQARVDAIRHEQEALGERLAAAVDNRRAVETLFTELDRNQSAIERAVAEIEEGDDATQIEAHLRKLGDFIKATHARFDVIEQMKATLLEHRGQFGMLQTRLDPLEDEHGGVRGLIREMHEFADRLSGNIDGLMQNHEGSLEQRVAVFADRKRELAQRVAHLDDELLALAAVRRDVGGLYSNLGRALNSLTKTEGDANGADLDTRLDEVATFVHATQSRFDDVEQAMAVLAQLKDRFDALQTRLVPLTAETGGVKYMLEELRDIRDLLAAKINRLERDEECALVERVQKFTENKKQLEERVTSLSEQFSQLASIRKDIGGLLAKLSGTITSSMS